MKSRDFGFLIIGALVGFVGFALLQLTLSSQPERAPTIAGQEVPKENFTVDFSRRYNLTLNNYKGDKTYENVKILGYTGKTVRESTGSISGGYDYFERWFAIELPDKRRAYLSQNSISYLEEANPAPTP